MTRTILPHALPGTADASPRAYEAPHALLSRRAATEGFVLLKNENDILPLKAGSRLALYGAGACRTVKGGTGSGDVNERGRVTVWEGLKNAGFDIVTEDWLRECDRMYDDARLAWRDAIMAKAKKVGDDVLDFFDAYATTPFEAPAGPAVRREDADVAIFVLGRVAGEGADRFNAPGDYLLSDEEHAILADICRDYRDVVVLINAGGVVDLGFMDEFDNIRGLMVISQPGMEGGNAVAEVLTGTVSPCGKLTDTWALRYADYPGAAEYSHNNGNTDSEYYHEGIYVGYRYFDSFGVPARYGFGEGLSYTRFEFGAAKLAVDRQGDVIVSVSVTNAGKRPGREVVQVYAMPPAGRLEKEVRRLAAFGKTNTLNPGETQTLALTFDAQALASYDEAAAAWVLEAGRYGIFLGDSLAGSRLIGWLVLEADKVLIRVKNICPLKEALEPLTLAPDARRARCDALTAGADAPEVAYDLSAVETLAVDYAEPAAVDDEAARIVGALETEQLIALAAGDPVWGQGSALGSAGIAVPGSAGQTSGCALDQGVADIVLADGPAGLRLNEYYFVKDGRACMLPFEASIEHGLFHDKPEPDLEKRYQYCTAIPVGTLLAQTWDVNLIEQVGAMIGEEMEEFGVTLWLAPGMNIHRNPLCGRNFEYYSEDPLVSGRIAAAMTRGVQAHAGCGTTVKHFCCNNQEDNRLHCDSVLSERALREIYLRGFGIAVREAQPLAIMTSYNLINGVHAANNHDICTDVARREFGFGGLIMTDWTTTEHGDDCTAAGCMRAGNDLVMPGQFSDHESIRAALKDGTLSIDELRACITRIVRVILQSNRYAK